MDDCIFCKIAQGKIDSAKIYEDEKFVAFLDMNPINPGHTLVVPKKHIDNIFDIEEPLYSELFQIAKKLSQPIKNAMESRRIGISVEGFGVPHAHVHLVPINRGFELDPNRAKSAIPEELKKIGEKIKEEINKN